MTDWDTDSDDRLYSISELDRTPLGRLSRRTRYRLIDQGQLPALVIGHRRYVRRSAIRRFLAEHETGASDE